jgi:hypothetical protein
LNNNTAGVREREDAKRTREAGHLDEILDVDGPSVEAFGGMTESGAEHRAQFQKKPESELIF